MTHPHEWSNPLSPSHLHVLLYSQSACRVYGLCAPHPDSGNLLLIRSDLGKRTWQQLLTSTPWTPLYLWQQSKSRCLAGKSMLTWVWFWLHSSFILISSKMVWRLSLDWLNFTGCTGTWAYVVSIVKKKKNVFSDSRIWCMKGPIVSRWHFSKCSEVHSCVGSADVSTNQGWSCCSCEVFFHGNNGWCWQNEVGSERWLWLKRPGQETWGMISKGSTEVTLQWLLIAVDVLPAQIDISLVTPYSTL